MIKFAIYVVFALTTKDTKATIIPRSLSKLAISVNKSNAKPKLTIEIEEKEIKGGHPSPVWSLCFHLKGVLGSEPINARELLAPAINAGYQLTENQLEEVLDTFAGSNVRTVCTTRVDSKTTLKNPLGPVGIDSFIAEANDEENKLFELVFKRPKNGGKTPWAAYVRKMKMTDITISGTKLGKLLEELTGLAYPQEKLETVSKDLLRKADMMVEVDPDPSWEKGENLPAGDWHKHLKEKPAKTHVKPSERKIGGVVTTNPKEEGTDQVHKNIQSN
jgi:hypothetical protein